MRKLTPIVCALIGLILTAAIAPPALAQDGGPDPQEIAQACIESVTARAEARVQRNQMIAANCVAHIEELLEAGETEAAEQAARRCIHRVRAASHRAVHRIQHRCLHCIHRLLMLGAPGLAGLVHETCEQAVGAVRQSRTAAVDAIEAALGG